MRDRRWGPRGCAIAGEDLAGCAIAGEDLADAIAGGTLRDA
jgi:hypothetical protein